MSRRGGFTLLEICLAVMIALMLVAIAVPSIQDLFAEQRLKKSFERFDEFVRKIHFRAVNERRAFAMIWDGAGILVQPDEPTEEGSEQEAERFEFTDGPIALERPVALVKNPPVEWLFWRSGTCEPAVLHYKGDAGTWPVRYDPLTVRGTFLDQSTP